MQISSALILTDRNKILLAKSKLNHFWDIIKGKIEENETPKDALIRETHEECGLRFGADLSLDNLKYYGLMDYIKTKKLEVFYYITTKLPDIHKLKCNSTFELFKKTWNEFDFYEYVPIEEIKNYTTPNLYKVLNIVLKEII